jgi:hypothetical protein
LADLIRKVARRADNAISSGQQQAVILKLLRSGQLRQRVRELFGRAVNVANDGPFRELLKHALKAAADINGLVGVKLNHDLRQPAIKKIGQEVRANLASYVVCIQGCD